MGDIECPAQGTKVFQYLRLVFGVLKDKREMSGREGNDFREGKGWGDRSKGEGVRVERRQRWRKSKRERDKTRKGSSSGEFDVPCIVASHACEVVGTFIEFTGYRTNNRREGEGKSVLRRLKDFFLLDAAWVRSRAERPSVSYTKVTAKSQGQAISCKYTTKTLKQISGSNSQLRGTGR